MIKFLFLNQQERDREREREKDRERKRERESQILSYWSLRTSVSQEVSKPFHKSI